MLGHPPVVAHLKDRHRGLPQQECKGFVPLHTQTPSGSRQELLLQALISFPLRGRSNPVSLRIGEGRDER